MSSKEFQWLSKQDMRKYKGKWVAILDKNIIASGRNAKEIWERVRKKYKDSDPLFAKIPEEDLLIL